VALGTPCLLRNLPRQQPNQDYDDDAIQETTDASAAELSSLGVCDESSSTTVSRSVSADNASGDVYESSAGPASLLSENASATSNQIILRLLEEGEMVSVSL
jgi:hypothetical protein